MEFIIIMKIIYIMKENGNIIEKREQELKSIKMGVGIKANLKMDLNMVQEYIFVEMGQNMKEIGEIICQKGMESINFVMVVFVQDIGIQIGFGKFTYPNVKCYLGYFRKDMKNGFGFCFISAVNRSEVYG